MYVICRLVWRHNISDYISISIIKFKAIVKSFFSLTLRPVTGKVKPKYNLPGSEYSIDKQCMVPGQGPEDDCR